MTIRAYPYDTTDAAGSVTELEWRRLMQWITPSGVLRGEDGELAVTQRAAGANMSVDVATGAAFIVGHYLRSDAVASVAIADNLTGNPRIDTIVVRVDFVANTGTIACLAGTVAAAPAPADLTQDLTTVWEEALAYVYVAAGENVSITTPEISDCRHYATPQAQDQTPVARLATAAPLAASTITGLSRVANANGALANIDGVAAVVGDVILDKDHATSSARGLWRVIDVGSATKPWRMRRSYAADTSAKVRAMLMIRVSEGTANGNTAWLLTTDDPIVLGTTALTFTQFGGSTGGGAKSLAHAEYNGASQTGITSTFTALTSMTVTPTIGANAVRVRGWGLFSKTGGAGYCSMRVFDSTASAAVFAEVASSIASGEFVTLPIDVYYAPAAGARTLIFQGAAESNTMTFLRGELWVEEIV